MAPTNDFQLFSERLNVLDTLAKSLPESVPLAKKSDAIYKLFEKIPVPKDPASHFEVFNRRMDILFGNDVRHKKTGRLINMKRGAFGIDLVLTYIKEATEAGFLIWDVAVIKINRLIEEIEIIWYAL
jgi:hypothetical protein